MSKYLKQPSGTEAQSHFSAVPKAEIERSTFNRSHGLKTTFNEGLLVPVYVDEILPGDTFNMSSTMFGRLATPLKPIMDNMYLDTHYFFVPYRLVWDNWQNFCGERRNPDDDPNQYTVPQYLISHNDLDAPLAYERLYAYMGIPNTPSLPVANVEISALPFRAYYLIWNEYYRDQNIQDSIVVPRDDGPDNFSAYLHLLPRMKRKDYFTSALPWPQKGDSVYIPLGTTAPVVTNSVPPSIGIDGTKRILAAGSTEAGGANIIGYPGATATGAPVAFNWWDTGMMADLTAATAVSINDLRTAFQIQRLLERDARGGTRYIELILSHFGVHSDDARLQRPEYLGGATANININPVASTAALDVAPQANLAATGTVIGKAGFSKSFTEHGVIIGIVSVRADLTYQQGIERFWNRKTRYDFYWPALAHLGEQAILAREIYYRGNPTLDAEVFGYQERYAEYRYKPSRITGLFQSVLPTSLDVWHLAQEFGEMPTLNATFMQERPPIGRTIAVQDEPHFLLDAWFQLSCTRPMPTYSVPGMIDHF